MAWVGPAEYAVWLQRYERLDAPAKKAMHAVMEGFSHRPLISVVMPTYNTPPDYLRAAIRSIREQFYPHWELCIADDASTDPAVRSILTAESGRDRRLKLAFRQHNGHICAATNTALTLATGEFVALVDHDDLLPPHALYLVALSINQTPAVDVLYSDEDRIDAAGRRYAPFFKTAWNPELLLAQNCVSHLGVYRRSLLEDIGGLREGYEGSQDYDLALRATAATNAERILHIPQVLYHWRVFPRSTSFLHGQPSRSIKAASRALRNHLDARGIRADIRDSAAAGNFDVHPVPPDPLPGVTIIAVPANGRTTNGRVSDLEAATDYPCLDIVEVPVDAARDHLAAALDDAARAARNDVVLFLTDAFTPLSPDWLKGLVAQLAGSSIGAVGPKILSRRRRVSQSAYVLGGRRVARPGHSGQPHHSQGYYGRLQLAHRCSAVALDGLATRKACFTAVRGLAAGGLQTPLAAVDYCLRLRARGWATLWVPQATLRATAEGAGGPAAGAPPALVERDRARLWSRWPSILSDDPGHNPNLSLDDGRYGLAEPPRLSPRTMENAAAAAKNEIGAVRTQSSV